MISVCGAPSGTVRLRETLVLILQESCFLQPGPLVRIQLSFMIHNPQCPQWVHNDGPINSIILTPPNNVKKGNFLALISNQRLKPLRALNIYKLVSTI